MDERPGNGSLAWLRLRSSVWRFGTLPLVEDRLAHLPSPSLVDRSFFGYRLHLDLARSNAHRLLYLEGQRYLEERHLLRRLVRPGMSVVDVGANIGYYMLLFARLAGPEGRLLCIEPEPANYAELERNRDANELERVRLVQAAVGDEDRTTGFRTGLNGTVVDAGPGDLTAELVRLDSLVDHPPDLVKIDVEGYEGRVLEGAAGLIRDHRPALFVELHPWLLYPPHDVDDVYDFLRGFYPDLTVYARRSGDSLADKVRHRYLGVEAVEPLEDPLPAVRPGGPRHAQSVWIVCRPTPSDAG